MRLLAVGLVLLTISLAACASDGTDPYDPQPWQPGERYARDPMFPHEGYPTDPNWMPRTSDVFQGPGGFGVGR